MWSHATRFKLTKTESPNIVLVDLNMEVGQGQGLDIKDLKELLKEINEWGQVLARLAECNILSFHCGETEALLHMRLPQYKKP